MNRFIQVNLKILLFLVIIAMPIYAQVNVESYRKTKIEEGFSHKLTARLGYFDGNVNISSFITKYRTDYANLDYSAFLIGEWQSGESDGDQYINRRFFHLRGIKPINEIYSLEMFLQQEHDEFLLLEERQLIGTGLRIPWLKASKNIDFKVDLGIGIMQEYEIIGSDDLEKESVPRSTNYLSYYWKPNKQIHILGTSYYQFSFLDNKDFRILLDLESFIEITDFLAFNIHLKYRYDANPPEELKKYDIEITNGITMTF